MKEIMMTTFPSHERLIIGREREEGGKREIPNPMREEKLRQACSCMHTTMQSCPLIITPICISCSSYACHIPTRSIAQTNQKKRGKKIKKNLNSI